MNHSDELSRRSWTPPDRAPSDPLRTDGDLSFGPGLAWLGASPARPGRPHHFSPDPGPSRRPSAGMTDGLGGVGPAGDGRLAGGPPRGTADAGRVGGGPGAGLAGGAPEAGGPGGGGPGGSGVLTWLPDGRWVVDGAVAEEPPVVEAAGRADRRWGRRRVALARLGARAAGWPRRVAIGALLLAAGVLAVRPTPGGTVVAPAVPTTDLVVAARDVPAGTVLGRADLRTVALPTSVTPAGVTGRPDVLLGRVAAGPLRRGEPVTDARVVGPGLAAGLGPEETTVVPVRIADPETAALVRAGDRIDVLGTPVDADGGRPAGAEEAVEVAAGLRVLAVLGGRDAAEGVVLVLAATQPTARRLAGAGARHRLTVSVRPP